MPTESALRTRLEGRAELLEATRVRYRALLTALEALWWRPKARRCAPVLLEVAAREGAVAEALQFTARHGRAEGWPPGPVLRLVDEVQRLQERLRRAVERRLGPAATHRLPDDLREVERLSSAAPRLVLPTQRWATACAALPRTLEAVATAERFGALLERLFARPLEVQGPLPFTADDARALEIAWTPGAEALEAAFARLDEVDRTGGTGRALRRRARRLPRGGASPVGPGAAVVVHAEFWRRMALARLEQLVAPRVAPAHPSPEEAAVVLAWLVRRRSEPGAVLPLLPARAALLELAHELSGPPPPGGRPWARLEGLAAAADRVPDAADWRALRDALALQVRVAATRTPWLPPVYREPLPARPAAPPGSCLVELVGQLRSQL
jgi:hypothetical protein